MAGDWLLAGVDAPSTSRSNHGVVSMIDLRDGEVSPIRAASSVDHGSASDGNEGVTGIATLSDGRVVRSVSNSSTRTGSGVSELIVQDSAIGPVVRRVAIELDGQRLAIADLTTSSNQRQVIGITAADPNANQTAQLVQIDVESGAATRIGDTGLTGQISIAMSPEGTLFAVSQENGFAPLMLHRIDASNAAIVDSRAVVDVSPYGFTTGLAVQPATGLLFASESHMGRFFTIDPNPSGPLTRTFLPTQAPLRGVTGDIAFVTRQDSSDITQLFHANFDVHQDAFTIDNSGGDVAGMWHRSLGRRADGQLNHSLSGSFYYGLFEGPTGGGNTIRDRSHRGVIESPKVALPTEGSSILSFSYLLDTRPELNRDWVTVSIDDGTNVTPILSRADGTLPETSGDWLTATYDLSAFAGQTISVEFLYDSGDPTQVDPEGWYIDDVIIAHVAEPPPLQVDLTTTKASSRDEVAPLDSLVYTITVTNRSISETAATGLTVVDTLPSELTLDPSGTTTGYRVDLEGRLIWEIDSLPIGETLVLTVATFVNDSNIGGEMLVMTNLVTATADQPDMDPSDNSARKDVIRNTPKEVDLVADKFVDRPIANANDTLVYTIDVTNSAVSNAEATNVVVVDTLPDDVTLVESGTTAGFVILPDGRVQWTIDTLAVEATSTFQITVMINDVDFGADSGLLTNSVVVTAVEPDPMPLNNSSSVTTEVPPVPLANLSADKTLDQSNPVIGQSVLFTVTVSNADDSRSDATGVTVTDSLPVGLTVVNPSTDITTTAGTYDLASGTWDGFDLARGQSETLTVLARVESIAAGRVLTNTATVMGDQADPDDGDNRDSVEVIPTQTVQFITPLSVFRRGSLVELSTDLGEITVAADEGAIVGFAWADINLNGDWDDGEKGREGFRFFLDLNLNGSFDPETEPSAVTDLNGRYVFAGLTPDTYSVLETDFELDTQFISTTPGGGVHSVTVGPGEVVSGSPGTNEMPNFGGFEFAVYVRPADQFATFATDRDFPLLLPSLIPWQTVTITNPNTSSAMQVVSLDDSAVPADVRGLIHVRQLSVNDEMIDELINGDVDFTSPVTVPAGESVRFMIFFDPAVRTGDGDQVQTQYPDWLAGTNRNEFITFESGQHLDFVTDTGRRFPVNLAGGSTFDSDVSHDGQVDFLDFTLVDDLMLRQSVIVKGDPLFDPTMDINARCPNGADAVAGTCTFPVGPMPRREIGMGDFGPLNVEFTVPIRRRVPETPVEVVDAVLVQIFG